MSDGKWLKGLREDMPVVVAARLVLLARLEPVRDRLAKAVFHSEEDAEHIHQLRVSTRRAGAALRIFAECLPKKIHRKVRKILRRIRRAAGAARDWDVFLESLVLRQRKATTAQKPGLDLLIGIAHGQRMAAQQILVQAVQEPPLDVEGLINRTISALTQPADHPSSYTLWDMAVPSLSECLGLLDQAVREDLQDYANLHQVRIRGKRLRYAMEIFASCYDGSFQTKFYPAVEQMQEILGNANDSYVATARLESIRSRIQATQPGKWKQYQPAILALLRHHQRALLQQRQLFVTWWRDWQQSGAEEAFKRLVKSNYQLV